MVRTGGSAAATAGGVRIWLMAARPRTLPAAVAPVLVGTALAGYEQVFHPLRFVAALLGAILIQVGTNLSNDYSDARRGADAEDRLGPVRVTAGGLVPPKQVLVATYMSFGLAVLVGVYLVVVAGWQLLLVGLASILAGVAYTGGPRPMATRAWASCSCFCSSASLRSRVLLRRRSSTCSGRRSRWRCRSGCWRRRSWSSTTSATSTQTAGPASARWRSGSAASGRGSCSPCGLPRLPARARHLGVRPAEAVGAVPWLTVLLAAGVVRIVRNQTDGPSLNQALAQTGMLQLAFCMLLSAGLLLSG